MIKPPPPNSARLSVRSMGIRTIAGGFAGGGSTNSSRKRYLRSVNSVDYFPPRTQPPITFSDEDFSAHDPKQDDPVMVTATIANWRVHKVLIDQGSSGDVLVDFPETQCTGKSRPVVYRTLVRICGTTSTC